jgi:hypothetical protein
MVHKKRTIKCPICGKSIIIEYDIEKINGGDSNHVLQQIPRNLKTQPIVLSNTCCGKFIDKLLGL